MVRRPTGLARANPVNPMLISSGLATLLLHAGRVVACQSAMLRASTSPPTFETFVADMSDIERLLRDESIKIRCVVPRFNERRMDSELSTEGRRDDLFEAALGFSRAEALFCGSPERQAEKPRI